MLPNLEKIDLSPMRHVPSNCVNNIHHVCHKIQRVKFVARDLSVSLFGATMFTTSNSITSDQIHDDPTYELCIYY
jgi:hypothetical protein